MTLNEAREKGREIKPCPICGELVWFAHKGGDAYNATGPSPEGTITLACRCSMHQDEWEQAPLAGPWSDRVAQAPDGEAGENFTMWNTVEVNFAIPVFVTREQERRLHDLLNEITRSKLNQKKAGVHWISSYGSKPQWSQADAAFMGKPVDPDAPEAGEPTFDDSVYCIETAYRGFVSDQERVKHAANRAAQGSRTAMTMLPWDELAEVLRVPNCSNYCIGVIVKPDHTVILLRGDCEILTVPGSMFKPTTDGVQPDFSDYAPIDHGQTLKFGEYESSFEAVLLELANPAQSDP